TARTRPGPAVPRQMEFVSCARLCHPRCSSTRPIISNLIPALRPRSQAQGVVIVEPSLDPVEIRVLGCLIEKQITTPEYYPLTLNALVNACNQTTNRDPVTHYDEDAIERGLERLREKALVWFVRGGRAVKYEHRFA